MSIIERIVTKFSQNPYSKMYVTYEQLNQVSFENTYKQLCIHGFTNIKEENVLKILSGEINAEIKTSSRIKDFCKSNVIPVSTDYFKLTSIVSEDNDEYNFKSKLFTKELLPKEGDVKKLIHNWNNITKVYTITKSIIMTSSTFKGLEIHFIISKRDNKGFKFSQSTVFNARESYKIRLVPTVYGESLVSHIRIVSKYILIGLQNSAFPLKKSTMNNISKEYSDTYGAKFAFIGPSSFTLQQSNLIDNDNDSPYVINNFCVTDKADGERRILYVAMDGKLYMISTKLEIQYTGAYVTDPALYGTVVDGEYIIHDKYGTIINTYAAFDVYIMNVFDKGKIHKKDIRPLEFANVRYKLLKKVITAVAKSMTINKQSTFNIEVKQFYFNKGVKKDFYSNCKSLFKSMLKKSYNTDGIILTHELFGVGMTDTDTKIKNSKSPWTHSFKWKPPELNTIDFKVFVINEPPKLLKNPVTNNLEPYKRIHLYVGNSRNKYNDIQKILLMGIPTTIINYRDNTGIFAPTKEIDPEAHVCYLPYTNDVDGYQKIYTVEGDVIEHNNIVEFSYNLEADKSLRWIPLKVRHDKQYPNGFDTANSNWYSIHHPVNPSMLMKPSNMDNNKDIMGQITSVVNDQVYFGAIDKSTIKTVNLKKFHHFIKYYIYNTVFERTNSKQLSVIDYSIGRGADIKKYINNNVKYLLGIDLAASNIHNTTDGPAKRYLDEVKQNPKKLLYMFIEGNSSKPIFTDDFSTDIVSNDVIDIYMGKKDIKKYDLLTKHNMHGKFRSGFDVGSVQFTLHYMFANLHTLHGFAKNCYDTIKMNGYLVGTCYDGKKIFKLLSNDAESRELRIDNTVIWGIKKEYNSTTFENNDTCLGQSISVYQETLGHFIQEYLVHFDYLKHIMSMYGFTSEFELKDSTGKTINTIDSFESLYNKNTLHVNESKISFLNNYFIFKKTNTINSEVVYNNAIKPQRHYTIYASNAISIGKYEIKG